MVASLLTLTIECQLDQTSKSTTSQFYITTQILLQLVRKVLRRQIAFQSDCIQIGCILIPLKQQICSLYRSQILVAFNKISSDVTQILGYSTEYIPPSQFEISQFLVQIKPLRLTKADAQVKVTLH